MKPINILSKTRVLLVYYEVRQLSADIYTFERLFYDFRFAEGKMF